MKKAALAFIGVLGFGLATVGQDYPNPEFNNEVYAFQKDSSKLFRLEKQTATVENKTSIVSGSRVEYNIDAVKATVRLGNIDRLSFVFWTGAAASGIAPGVAPGSRGDSMIRASGVDPSLLNVGGANSPDNLSLYRMDAAKGRRTILLVKAGGYFSKKGGESEKYSLSTKRIREGYFEMFVDKKLPPGEYAFVIRSQGMDMMRGGVTLFCFGVD
ncbi:hypothetical protein ACQ86N_21820 [Puia sp. P3]|uniref:hypothetical protein n=1 Tax=Puia sp. P3 TaxID=3423952 RepID=UPI003D67AB32